jgi:hypothetical protein
MPNSAKVEVTVHKSLTAATLNTPKVGSSIFDPEPHPESHRLPLFNGTDGTNEIHHQFLAHLRHNRFRVKLDPFDTIFLVPYRHDFTFIRPCTDLEALWQG